MGGTLAFILTSVLSGILVCAEDPYQYEDWTVSYISASPLGVSQKVSSVHLSASASGITDILLVA